jgi:hypothetical protein
MGWREVSFECHKALDNCALFGGYLALLKARMDRGWLLSEISSYRIGRFGLRRDGFEHHHSSIVVMAKLP